MLNLIEDDDFIEMYYEEQEKCQEQCCNRCGGHGCSWCLMVER